ncbi:MAG: hypothetical protein IJV76_11370, partial [Clostridia bacterium]|nr:hypothetical protein [Clostridia bacterium]
SSCAPSAQDNVRSALADIQQCAATRSGIKIEKRPQGVFLPSAPKVRPPPPSVRQKKKQTRSSLLYAENGT